MAKYKLTNPQVVGKISFPSEIINRALFINASGELESSTVTSTELGHLSGVTSGVQSQINSKADTSTLNAHTADTANPHNVTKTQVGLSNVPNVDATNRANHTGTQTASTISDFDSAAKTATVADSISDSITDVAPSQNAVFDALALKADLVLGKVPLSQLPAAVLVYKGVYNATTNSPTLADGVGTAGSMYKVTVAGTQDFGSGNITFNVGDYIILNDSMVWEKSDTTDAVNSVNGQVGDVTLTKSDVGLGNVDNTSDATKNSATATLTNKSIDADNNTISNLEVDNLKSGVLDTDLSSVSASHDTIPSAKAVKDYVDANIGASSVNGDIALTTFAAANNQASAASITGFAFSAAVVRGFKALVTISVDATSDLYETVEIIGVQKASGFDIAVSGAGDDTGVVFSITSAGQVQYTTPNFSGFVSCEIAFRAIVTNV